MDNFSIKENIDFHWKSTRRGSRKIKIPHKRKQLKKSAIFGR